MARNLPVLELYDCQESVPLDVAGLKFRLHQALLRVLKSPPGPGEDDLAELDTIELSILSDDAIADAHGEFLDDPTPTDVITFPYGEILVSADTAQLEAGERGWPVERELLLYLIHGLLHLHGYLDEDPADQEAMHAVQNGILEEIWPIPSPNKPD